MSKQMPTLRLLDSTLRDGEQSPGASMTIEQKLEVALRLESLGVDAIEAGFPISSPGEFEAVQRIARRIERSEVAALTLARPEDIANAVVFLSSDQLARHVTGQTIVIAGGMEGRWLWLPEEINAAAV